MNSLHLPSVAHFVSSHSPLALTINCGAVVAIGVLLALLIREAVATTAVDSARRARLRRCDVVVIPLLVLLAVVIAERFLILA